MSDDSNHRRPAKVLILEDQLRARNSHHFEYLGGIAAGAGARGWEATVLCQKGASADVVEDLRAEPLLEGLSGESLQSLPGALRRKIALIRRMLGNMRTLSRKIGREGSYEKVLVPTAWFPQIAMLLPALLLHGEKIRLLCLIFVHYEPDVATPSLQFRAIRWMLRLFQGMNRPFRVFAETSAARATLQEFLGVPVTEIPHAVPAPMSSSGRETGRRPVFGFYGFARHEQGADVLLNALKKLESDGTFPDADFHFVWPRGFHLPDGQWIDPDSAPELHGKVTFYRQPLVGDRYRDMLARTDWIVLPYRSDSYAGRCSRVSIEACCLGIPGIYATGTHLEEVFRRFGSGIAVRENDPEALAASILEAFHGTAAFRRQAEARMASAREFFSPAAFWRCLEGSA
jgi:hypothetical protein